MLIESFNYMYFVEGNISISFVNILITCMIYGRLIIKAENLPAYLAPNPRTPGHKTYSATHRESIHVVY